VQRVFKQLTGSPDILRLPRNNERLDAGLVFSESQKRRQQEVDVSVTLVTGLDNKVLSAHQMRIDRAPKRRKSSLDALLGCRTYETKLVNLTST
jgi:hypothetical protein